MTEDLHLPLPPAEVEVVEEESAPVSDVMMSLGPAPPGVRREFNCTKCGESKGSLKSLRQHEKLAHPEEGVKKDKTAATVRSVPAIGGGGGVSCRAGCPEKFKDVKERNIHYKTAHKGEAIFHCNQCQESFVSKYSLMRHREKHKNITYTCEVCSATFSVSHPFK